MMDELLEHSIQSLMPFFRIGARGEIFVRYLPMGPAYCWNLGIPFSMDGSKSASNPEQAMRHDNGAPVAVPWYGGEHPDE